MQEDSHVLGWAFKKHQESSIIITSLTFVLAILILLIAPSIWTVLLFVVITGIWIVILNFFRDPDREIKWSPDLVLCPADGVIADISTVSESDYFGEPRTRIGIFLALKNVHVQRVPMSGNVAFVTHQEGKNLRAFDPAASSENENITMGVNTDSGLVVIKQISGILARKCYNYSQVGDQILAGQRYGLIKFGSRVEIFLPPDANVQCKVDDKVKAGVSILARIAYKD